MAPDVGLWAIGLALVFLLALYVRLAAWVVFRVVGPRVVVPAVDRLWDVTVRAAQVSDRLDAEADALGPRIRQKLRDPD